jgi:Flp pilus assembly protein CpaB
MSKLCGIFSGTVFALDVFTDDCVIPLMFVERNWLMKGSMVLFIAVIIGTFAAVLAKSHLDDAEAGLTEGLEPEEVCVAKRNLLPQHVIDIETDIIFKAVRRDLAMTKGYVLASDIRSLDGLPVKVEIIKGKLIDRYYLGRSDAKEANVESVLNPHSTETRLLPIKVNEVTGISGHLKPGDLVDVIHTNREVRTHMMMRSVLVRFVGRPSKSRQRQTTYTSVTVEVSPLETLVLTNAMASGTITLAKCNPHSYTGKDPNKFPVIEPTVNYPEVLGVKGKK